MPRPTLLFGGGSGYETRGNVTCEGSINVTMKETVTIISHSLLFKLAYASSDVLFLQISVFSCYIK